MARFSIYNERHLNDINAVNLNIAETLNAPTLQTNYSVIRATGTGQTPISGALAQILFTNIDTINYSSNPQSKFNYDAANSQFFVTQGGLYEINIGLQVSAITPANLTFARVWISDPNPSTILYAIGNIPIGTGSNLTINISPIVNIASNSILRAYIHWGGSTNLTINANSAIVPVYFQLRYLGGITP